MQNSGCKCGTEHEGGWCILFGFRFFPMWVQNSRNGWHCCWFLRNTSKTVPCDSSVTDYNAGPISGTKVAMEWCFIERFQTWIYTWLIGPETNGLRNPSRDLWPPWENEAKMARIWPHDDCSIIFYLWKAPLSFAPGISHSEEVPTDGALLLKSCERVSTRSENSPRMTNKHVVCKFTMNYQRERASYLNIFGH